MPDINSDGIVDIDDLILMLDSRVYKKDFNINDVFALLDSKIFNK